MTLLAQQLREALHVLYRVHLCDQRGEALSPVPPEHGIDQHMECVGGTCGWRYGTLAYKAPLLKQKILGGRQDKTTSQPSYAHNTSIAGPRRAVPARVCCPLASQGRWQRVDRNSKGHFCAAPRERAPWSTSPAPAGGRPQCTAPRAGAAQRDFGWYWAGVIEWVRVAPQGCPGEKASGRTTWDGWRSLPFCQGCVCSCCAMGHAQRVGSRGSGAKMPWVFPIRSQKSVDSSLQNGALNLNTAPSAAAHPCRWGRVRHRGVCLRKSAARRGRASMECL